MGKTVILFGICLAALLGLLKWAEFMFFAHDLALEAYIGIVSLFCTALGAWIGWKLTRPNNKPSEIIKVEDLPDREPSLIDIQNKFGLSPREHEVLILISDGLSYQEIADRLHVSLSTIKTHASNIFSKMDVQRRTQAVMLAQKSGLLPRTKV